MKVTEFAKQLAIKYTKHISKQGKSCLNFDRVMAEIDKIKFKNKQGYGQLISQVLDDDRDGGKVINKDFIETVIHFHKIIVSPSEDASSSAYNVSRFFPESSLSTDSTRSAIESLPDSSFCSAPHDSIPPSADTSYTS